MQHRKQCHRYNIPGHAHELTFCCYQHRAFLNSERTCHYLAEAIIRAKAIHQFDLWAYVFMPEHVHLLICPRKESYSISKILLSIKQPVSRRVLIYLRKNNPSSLRLLATGQKHTPYRFWLDGGGYDRNITIGSTLIDVVRYIHNNPVRRGLVSRPEDWLWSSATDWNCLGKGAISVDIDSFPRT
ncbi:MAG: transposase [Candidatus Zixiibacteriota bacterium]